MKKGNKYSIIILLSFDIFILFSFILFVEVIYKETLKHTYQGVQVQNNLLIDNYSFIYELGDSITDKINDDNYEEAINLIYIESILSDLTYVSKNKFYSVNNTLDINEALSLKKGFNNDFKKDYSFLYVIDNDDFRLVFSANELNFLLDYDYFITDKYFTEEYLSNDHLLIFNSYLDENQFVLDALNESNSYVGRFQLSHKSKILAINSFNSYYIISLCDSPTFISCFLSNMYIFIIAIIFVTIIGVLFNYFHLSQNKRKEIDDNLIAKLLEELDDFTIFEIEYDAKTSKIKNASVNHERFIGTLNNKSKFNSYIFPNDLEYHNTFILSLLKNDSYKSIRYHLLKCDGTYQMIKEISHYNKKNRIIKSYILTYEYQGKFMEYSSNYNIIMRELNDVPFGVLLFNTHTRKVEVVSEYILRELGFTRSHFNFEVKNRFKDYEVIDKDCFYKTFYYYLNNSIKEKLDFKIKINDEIKELYMYISKSHNELGELMAFITVFLK